MVVAPLFALVTVSSGSVTWEQRLLRFLPHASANAPLSVGGLAFPTALRVL